MLQFLVRSEQKAESPQFFYVAQQQRQLAVVEAQPLPLLPVSIALARLIMQPIQHYRILDVAAPERFAWVEYTPHGAIDPVLPVPCVDFGSLFFERMARWVEHHRKWNPRLYDEQQREWAREGYTILEDLCGWIRAARLMTEPEKGWLMEALHFLWAEPQGPSHLK